MSSVRSRSPAPALSPDRGRRFCSWFCTLRSPSGLIELVDGRHRGGIAADVAPDDLCDMLLLPGHNLGDDALRQSSDVEPSRGRAAQVVEMQVALVHAGTL